MDIVAEITVVLFFLACIPLVLLLALVPLIWVAKGVFIVLIDYTAYKWLRKGLRR